LKKILLLVFLSMLGFIWVNRMRVFVRDPLATVSKCSVATGEDCVVEAGVQVYINYLNDVLLEQDAQPGAYRTLVQGWNNTPGSPTVLKCIRWMACMTDADHASSFPMDWNGKGKYEPKVTMSSRVVSFIGSDGAPLLVVLR
jgi:hypothetical protein